MSGPFYTIGHSTRSMEDFAALLQEAGVTFLADVRTVPRSRTNPQYNSDVFPAALQPYQIGYEHMAALGGLRHKNRDVSPDVNGFWQNDSFHNYADYAMQPAFRTGLSHLQQIGQNERCAIMCAEAVWWRCHRRIIADYLIAAGETVLHIMAPHHIEPAHMTEAARHQPSGVLTYPPE
jgi:uncharacterized protein (DUF488 family)